MWSISTLTHPLLLFNKIIQYRDVDWLSASLILPGFVLMVQRSFRKVISWRNTGSTHDSGHTHRIFSTERAHVIFIFSVPDSSQTLWMDWELHEFSKVSAQELIRNFSRWQQAAAFYFQCFSFVLWNISTVLLRVAFSYGLLSICVIFTHSFPMKTF